jgi:hypothetical protein
MKENGQRASAEKGRPKEASNGTMLSDLGITWDQSSKWQALAEVPEEQFEQALKDPTHGRPSASDRIAIAPQRREEPRDRCRPIGIKNPGFGQLFKEIEKKQGQRTDLQLGMGAHPKSVTRKEATKSASAGTVRRTQAARDAGISKRETKSAYRAWDRRRP